MNTGTHTLILPGYGEVELTVEERGHGGHPFLLLHGGAGPQSLAGFAQLLAEQHHARVFTPTHPGFGGTPRPDWLSSIARLAEAYAQLLDGLDLTDVTVVGNSIGGWIAAELALRDSSRISGIVLVGAVGIAVDEHPVVDFFSLSMDEVSRLSYHDPTEFGIDPATMSDAEKAGMAANRAALSVYGGQPPLVDSTLRGRLGQITLPTLVLWGDSDQLVDPDYGRAYADAIPDAEFKLLTDTGHAPEIETPEQLLRAVWAFADTHAT